MLRRRGFTTDRGSPFRVKCYMVVFDPYSTIEGLRLHLDIMRAQGMSPKKLATILKVNDNSDREKARG